MNNPRYSTYRTALQVSSELIALFSDVELNRLMGYLLKAQAYKCGSPLNQVIVNTEIKASDDGCDGWTAAPATQDLWLGTTDTCWQFKAGTAGEPARLAGEVIKRIPRQILLAGGSFKIIASGSTNGNKGEEDRLNFLIHDAEMADIPTDNIDVIGSERLANWCNQHPAVAAYFAGRPDGLWTLDDWLNSEEHQVPWQASASINSEISVLRSDLDFMTGKISHLHIQGQPGVGKTRFALELCRDAAWRSTVIYIRDASDIRLQELIDSAANDNLIQLMVVADEVQWEQLRLLRDSIERGNGRIRLITIGHCSTPDPTRIPAFPVNPLDPQVMAKVVTGWYPVMPLEHVNFVVRFADGYVRLAKLATEAVVRNPGLNVQDLLSRTEIRGFLDRMLGTNNRRPLYVVAILTSTGWTDDKQAEGRAIARHFGLDWNEVCYTIEEFDKHFGIVPRGGRYRYISPTPLGILLAVEAWNIYPDQLKSLPDVLPSDEARNAYYTRLQSMASNPGTQEFAREELDHFFRLDDFLEGGDVRRWSALASADPDQAARNILHAFISVNVEDRLKIEGEARREAIWTLVRLAWRSSSFHNAVIALALLAEAENEKWANNATGEFIERYQIRLGGTALPYIDRLPVLDELLSINRPSLTKLVIKALSRLSIRNESRVESRPISDELPEREWHPTSGNDYLNCVEEAIKRLNFIVNLGNPELQDDLVAAAENLSMMLLEAAVWGLVEDLFISIQKIYPQTREALRRIIADILKREKEYWKKIPPEHLAKIENLHSKFEDSSLSARLLQYVGVPSWDPDKQPDLMPLAKELYEAPDLLAENWPWLTSGEAQSSWQLGESLAKVDDLNKLAEFMPSLPGCGRDLRLLCGYMRIKRNERSDSWYDNWMNSLIEHHPEPETLIFEIIGRCGATVFIADKLVEILRTRRITPQLVGLLIFSRWNEDLPANNLENVLRAMNDTGLQESAIVILGERMRSHPNEIRIWDPLALQLVTSPLLIRSNQMTSYHWKEVANTLLPVHIGEIAAAIIHEHAERNRNGWYLEFSSAAIVLHDCTDREPKVVWRILQPYLSSPDAHRFIFGFPRGILDMIPFEEISGWIAENPIEHTVLISNLVEMNFSNDDTLAARMIGEYGNTDRVAGAFLSEYLTGTWWGPASIHWEQLATDLEEVIKRTAIPALRNWAINSARQLHEMAARERRRQEEEEIRGY